MDTKASAEEELYSGLPAEGEAIHLTEVARIHRTLAPIHNRGWSSFIVTSADSDSSSLEIIPSSCRPSEKVHTVMFSQWTVDECFWATKLLPYTALDSRSFT